MRRARLLLAVLAAIPTVAREAAAQTDTIAASPIALFTYRDAVLAGSVFVATLLARPFDDHYAARLQDSATQANRKLQGLATFVRTTAAPGSYIIGGSMYLSGRIFKQDRLADLGLHGTEALLIGEAVGAVIKGVAGRQRPYVRPRNPNNYQLFRGFGRDDAFRSFPSGHTTAAFAAAAAVTSETSRWWPNSRYYIGPAMFGGAALVGISRMYNNRHWASDVLVGAGIGTFAGLKVVRYHHTHPDNRIDRWLLSGSLTPSPRGGQTLHWSILPMPFVPALTGNRR
jgi:membrane-associated phospholipid phosphatase